MDIVYKRIRARCTLVLIYWKWVFFLAITEYIGRRLRYHRRTQDITIQELSETTGLSINFISSLERGKTNASINKVDILVKALNIYWADILPPKEK
jgi:predicted transcriptional regulator